MQNFAENCRFSKKQERAILELLNPSSRTIAEVAKQAGVSERTLHYWLKLPHFQERLECERARVRQEAFGKLSDSIGRAVEQLCALLTNENSNVKLKACQTVLDYGFKLSAYPRRIGILSRRSFLVEVL